MEKEVSMHRMSHNKPIRNEIICTSTTGKHVRYHVVQKAFHVAFLVGIILLVNFSVPSLTAPALVNVIKRSIAVHHGAGSGAAFAFYLSSACLYPVKVATICLEYL